MLAAIVRSSRGRSQVGCRLGQLEQARYMSSKLPKIDKSKVPKLDEHDLEEHFVSGSGPGGQSVNKAVNCCFLRHKPTGLYVKVHQQRDLMKNRKIARQLLTDKLDDLYNGEDSVSNQKKRIVLHKLEARNAENARKRSLKEEHKKMLEQSNQLEGHDESKGSRMA